MGESAGDRVGSVKPTQFRLDLARSFGFPARSDEVVWVSDRNPCLASLSSRIQREIRPAYHVFRPVLSSSLFLCLRPVCVGDGSLFLSLFLRHCPDLSSSLLPVAGRRMNRLDQIFFFVFERYQAIKKQINMKYIYIYIYSLDGFAQTIWNSGQFCSNHPEIHLVTLYIGRF